MKKQKFIQAVEKVYGELGYTQYTEGYFFPHDYPNGKRVCITCAAAIGAGFDIKKSYTGNADTIINFVDQEFNLGRKFKRIINLNDSGVSWQNILEQVKEWK